jgi:hypothetical protein
MVVLSPDVHDGFEKCWNSAEKLIDKVVGRGQNPRNSPSFMTSPCKHPIVKVVAREEDVEFVECQNCGDIFDSIEYEDMALEEKDDLSGHAALEDA